MRRIAKRSDRLNLTKKLQSFTYFPDNRELHLDVRTEVPAGETQWQSTNHRVVVKQIYPEDIIKTVHQYFSI